MKVRPSAETERTHRPSWRGCRATLELPAWITGGFCGEPGMICADCAAPRTANGPWICFCGRDWLAPTEADELPTRLPRCGPSCIDLGWFRNRQQQGPFSPDRLGRPPSETPR